MNEAKLLKYLDHAENDVLDMIKGQDQVGRDMLSSGAEDILSILSGAARFVFEETDCIIKNRYQKTIQGLIDFLEEDGFANLLKEADSIGDVAQYFPSIRVPDKYAEFVQIGLDL